MTSPPDRTDLRPEGAAQAPGGHDELRVRPPRSLRAALDRWLVRGIRSRWRLAKAKSAAPTLADLWNAWAVAELECAIALRAWQLAPRRDKHGRLRGLPAARSSARRSSPASCS